MTDNARRAVNMQDSSATWVEQPPTMAANRAVANAFIMHPPSPLFQCGTDSQALKMRLVSQHQNEGQARTVRLTVWIRLRAVGIGH